MPAPSSLGTQTRSGSHSLACGSWLVGLIDGNHFGWRRSRAVARHPSQPEGWPAPKLPQDCRRNRAAAGCCYIAVGFIYVDCGIFRGMMGAGCWLIARCHRRRRRRMGDRRIQVFFFFVRQIECDIRWRCCAARNVTGDGGNVDDTFLQS